MELMNLLDGKDVQVGVIDVASDAVETPEQVAGVIAGCLAGRPRARYLVGMDAQAAALTDRLTPTAVKDVVYRLALGMPRD